MKIHTKAVHAGDRKKLGRSIPSTTPVYLASSYIYENIEDLDRVFAHEAEGPSYARYGNPTNQALEELCTALEGGAGSLACASGMLAVEIAIRAALTDRRRTVVAAHALFGASINLLTKILEPAGVETRFVDVCDLDAVSQAVDEAKPGCVLLETVSNPMLRVADIAAIAGISRRAGAALVVDNTFATPLLVRPLELGANLVVHSLTKYLAGHGDVLGGVVIADAGHVETLHAMSRIVGPVLGPFESYLTMRGIKTFPLRLERQCANARAAAAWLRSHPKVERVHYLDDPRHPDAEIIRGQFPESLFGAIVSFELRDCGRDRVFRFMDSLRMIVRGTSLGDVHTMMLYPVMSSHREIPPKQRERLGIRDNLVRLSVGIEDVDDITADLEQALATI